MKDIYLMNYSVKGIKTIDQWITLSFYKKTISRHPNTQQYNIKGIYGMNGSGKSGIVTSVDILKNILINPTYLNNPIVQNNLDAIVNKRLETLDMEAEYMAEFKNALMVFRYHVMLSKDSSGKYKIAFEDFSFKKATSKVDSMDPLFCVKNGELILIPKDGKDELSKFILKKTMNLLTTTSVCALFFENIIEFNSKDASGYKNPLFLSLCTLGVFGRKLHVYMDQADDHRDYFLHNSIKSIKKREKNGSEVDALLNYCCEMDINHPDVLNVTDNIVIKKDYQRFEKTIEKLYEFLRIFKSGLQRIEIDKKEDRTAYICDLIMVYDDYKIHAEFESTGVKKLIRLFAYLNEMVQGKIVFIDEFDSNLHDVYLCALLEYLMEYGEGQLCFTTHNVGPMDILKQRKKSIDFLSVDHKIYPWTKSGNYSPSNLYRNGMIEGSPFNVDSIDFISVFSSCEEAD